MPPSRRYIVCEITGRRITPSSNNEGGGSRATTEVIVLDRWYSHDVVASYPSNRSGAQRLDYAKQLELLHRLHLASTP